ncbi:MAG: ketopantoate reductase [Deltaproteobacteria bacterium]|nr:ketopantoate reductase [Deltaproteobacteria bacterium]
MSASPEPSPRVLVIGAGAVGQVYGRHAQLGGGAVTFFVRAKYAADLAGGVDMYPLNRSRSQRTVPVRFEGFAVVSTAAEVAARRWDLVIITVSSPALRGPWLAELVAAVGDATIVALQPGRDDRDTILAAGASADRLVSGMITLISYSAPLPDETRFPRPGMAYWFPPLTPAPFSGPDTRVAAVVALFRRGKLPAKRDRDVPRAVAFPSAVMMAYLVALENAGWSFRRLVRETIQQGAQGAREALAVIGHREGRVPLGIRLVARPRILRMGLWFARRAIPLPLETYLAYHFTKVGDQTREFVAGYIARGREAGLPVDALVRLTAALPPGPAH